MTKTRLVLAAAVILALSAGAIRAAQPPSGQAATANLDVLVDAIRSNRKALVAVNLKLTDEETAKFWPIYDRYQKEITAVGDRLVAMIQDYTASFNDLSNDKAMKLVDDYPTIEADRVKVKRAYVDEFAKALPGRKVACFYQIENKMDAVIRYNLAASIPVLEDETDRALSTGRDLARGGIGNMKPKEQTSAMPAQEAGPWDDPALAKLREWEPAWVDQCRKMSKDPWTSGVLPRKDIELISIAVNAACTNLSADGTRRHIRGALEAGATRDEIMMILKMASLLSIHTVSLGAPILLEEAKAAGVQPMAKKPAATPVCDEMKAASQWNTAWDGFFELDPAWTEAIIAASLPIIHERNIHAQARGVTEHRRRCFDHSYVCTRHTPTHPNARRGLPDRLRGERQGQGWPESCFRQDACAGPRREGGRDADVYLSAGQGHHAARR